MELQNLIFQLSDNIVLIYQLVLKGRSVRLDSCSDIGRLQPQIVVFPLQLLQIVELVLQISHLLLQLLFVQQQILILLLQPPLPIYLIFPLLFSFLHPQLKLLQFGIKSISFLVELVLMTNLQQMQLMLKVSYLLLQLFDLLLILQGPFDIFLIGLPGKIFLNFRDISLKLANNPLVIFLLTPHLTLQFENSLIVMFDRHMQIVHDVLGLLNISHLLLCGHC